MVKGHAFQVASDSDDATSRTLGPQYPTGPAAAELRVLLVVTSVPTEPSL